METRCVWVLSPPRTGSMWVFNVIRDLYRNRNYRITPENIFAFEHEWVENRDLFAQQESTSPNPHRACISKSHTRFDQILRPDEKIFTTLRDPRDCLASYTRFMAADITWLENNWRSTLQSHVNLMNHIITTHKDRLTLIPYKEIIEDPYIIIKNIMNVLGEDTTPEDLALAEKYSKDNVRMRIKEEEKKHQEKGNNNTKTGTFIQTHLKGIRYLDFKTGFQTGHVSDYQDGDWAKILPSFVTEHITHFLEPYLDAYGFPK